VRLWVKKGCSANDDDDDDDDDLYRLLNDAVSI
jgi:hypothetical protein